MRRDPKYHNLFIKNCVFFLVCVCIYSYMFKLQLPSKYFPFDAIYLSRCFFHLSKQFLNLSILMPFSASAIFVSLLPHQQNISLWGLFSSGEIKKSLWVRSGEQGGWGMGVKTFLVKNCWTFSVVWAGVLINHQSWNGQMCWKSSEKFTEA